MFFLDLFQLNLKPSNISLDLFHLYLSLVHETITRFTTTDYFVECGFSLIVLGTELTSLGLEIRSIDIFDCNRLQKVFSCLWEVFVLCTYLFADILEQGLVGVVFHRYKLT